MAITNTFGYLTALRPPNTDEAQLYSVPAGTEINAVLRIVNQSPSGATVRQANVYHCPAGHGDVAGDAKHRICYFIEVGRTPIEISIHAGPTETIRVKSLTAEEVSFHLSGQKKVVS